MDGEVRKTRNSSCFGLGKHKVWAQFFEDPGLILLVWLRLGVLVWLRMGMFLYAGYG